MWFAVFYNVSVRKASKALIMRDYDTTISPLSDGSYQRSVRIIVRLVEKIVKTNLRAKQQSGKRHHYEESVEKAVARKDRQFKALVTKRMTCFYLMCRFLEVRGT